MSRAVFTHCETISTNAAKHNSNFAQMTRGNLQPRDDSNSSLKCKLARETIQNRLAQDDLTERRKPMRQCAFREMDKLPGSSPLVWVVDDVASVILGLTNDTNNLFIASCRRRCISIHITTCIDWFSALCLSRSHTFEYIIPTTSRVL